MVANPRRREQVAEAAVELLGSGGGRELTHRAVDRVAGLPLGTCANYFPSRVALMEGIAERCFELLAPDEDRLRDLAAVTDPEQALEAYLSYVVERLLARPALPLALIELRLEAARTPSLAARLGPFLRAGLEADVDFHAQRGLPGGRETVLALHHLVNGLVLDRLTVPLEPDADPLVTAASIARSLVRGADA